MKKALLVLLLISTNAMADWDNPTAPFDATNNTAKEMSIKWLVVDNVQKVCEVESRKRGFKGFGYRVNACSFWSDNQCVVVTDKVTTMHTLGHEVRHCFQGNWH
jgi:hypothetical protein